jgi:hypothetical protein
MGGEFEDVNSLVPPGLLGLFQIKSTGRTPRPLDSVQFTFPVDEFYMRALETWATGAGNIVAVGVIDALAGALDIVPAGFGRIVTGISCRATTGAAEFVRFRIGIADPSNTFFAALECPEAVSNIAGAAGAGIAATGTLQKFLLSPGQRLKVFVENVTTAGSIAVTTQYRYLQFPW